MHPNTGIEAVYVGGAGLYLLGVWAVMVGLLLLGWLLFWLPPSRRRQGYGFEVFIARPPDEVFSAITDVRRWPDRPAGRDRGRGLDTA